MTAACHDPVNVRTLDVSGNGLHATFGNGATPATYPTKLSGQRGYYLDGGDYLNVGNVAQLDFTTVGTVGILFKATINPTDYVFLIGKQKWVTGREGYAIYSVTPANTLTMDLRQVAAGSNNVNVGITINTGPVHFAVLRWTGSNIVGYNDGYTISAAQTINAAPQNWPFRIGADPEATAYKFTGNVYWAGAWDYALSEIQVRDLEARLRRELNDV
jgi:hypothetical protein